MAGSGSGVLTVSMMSSLVTSDRRVLGLALASVWLGTVDLVTLFLKERVL